MNDVTATAAVSAGQSERASRTQLSIYILLIVCAVVAAAYYRLRTDSIFKCSASGYSAERYLSYCNAAGYGDYDHGALWFNLEPQTTRAAATAEVLFVGNSRMAYGFSTSAAQEWLTKNVDSYYLLGFAYHPRVLFQRELLRKLEAHPRVYVINLDTFFQENASVPAQTVMTGADARARYRTKQSWQSVHRLVCGPLPFLCASSYDVFRDRKTGMWQPYGAISANAATSIDDKIDATEVAGEIAVGRAFIDKLGVDPRCVIFTLVPSVNAPSPSSAAIAKGLQGELISPEVEDLLTFDGSHLDRASAERWSGAFFDAAGPRIRECVRGQGGPTATAAQ